MTSTAASTVEFTLSPEQRRAVRGVGRRWPFVIAVSAVGGALTSGYILSRFGPGDVTVGIGAGAGIATLVIGYFFAKVALLGRERTAIRASGNLRLEQQRSPVGTFYFVHVGGTKLALDRATPYVANPGSIEYTKHQGLVLAVFDDQGTLRWHLPGYDAQPASNKALLAGTMRPR